MFALDLFNTRYERDLREGAVDDLEGRRIDDLNAKMDDLIARAREAKTPEHKAGLKREFDKVKDERDSYFKIKDESMGYGTLTGEGQVTPTATGSRHHAKPENYGGYEPEADPLARLDKHAVNRADKAMGVKFNREKKYQGGLDVDEGGIPGNVPVEKIPGKEDLLKGKGRSYYEDQKKNSEEIEEHSGGIGPKQHWQDLMQENKLSVGDPVVVTGPNEYEGKTGEIYEFSPSGTFVIVNLYNHGRHSMHLSNIAYNEYADQEQDEEDDWYDEEMEEGYAATIGPDTAPLPPEKQWRIQVRQLIADYIKNPQGLYNIAKQKGANSAEATAYKYIMHPTGKIALPPDAVTFEGYQDFNKVEPYAVCLAGKCVKKFDYYEEARRFHDNWKKKLYNAGNKEKADKITLMPLNLDEEEQKPGFGEFPPKQEITIVPPKKLKSGQTYQDQNKYWQSQGQAPIYKTNEMDKSQTPPGRAGDYPLGVKGTTGKPVTAKRVVKDLTKDLDQAFSKEKKVKEAGSPAQQAAIAIAKKKQQGVAEAMSQRNRAQGAIGHGLPWKSYDDLDQLAQDISDKILTITNIVKLNSMAHDSTIYNALERYFKKYGYPDNVFNRVASIVFKRLDNEGRRMTTDPRIQEENKGLYYNVNKRKKAGTSRSKNSPKAPTAQAWKDAAKTAQKEDMELGEDQDTSGVERAILNRIMTAHTDLLMKFGPEKVMQAAEEVAYNVGDVDEIGSSDVSAYVDQVKQILGVPSEVNEKWSQKYKSTINCANPKGFSQKAHCAGKKK